MLNPLLLLGLTTFAQAPQEPPKLSADGEACKAAFTELMKLKDNVGDTRIKDLQMPGAPEYFKSAYGMMGLYALQLSFDTSNDRAGEAIKLYSDILPKIDHLRSWDGYQTIYMVRAAKKYADPKTAEKVRTDTASLLKRTIAAKDFYGPVADMSNKLFPLDLAHVTGNAMQGKLLNHPAPPFKFLWSNDPTVKTLKDLKGKVIVLDFWATWCKPCIGLFPKVKEISAQYAGKPVVFVGVTSIQGYVVDPKNGKIDCKDNPKKEMSLMPDVLKQLGVTWTVAISDRDCFDPHFDIMEIPHMAVIDQSGVVRNSGIEPDDLPKTIDALLAEGTKESK